MSDENKLVRAVQRHIERVRSMASQAVAIDGCALRDEMVLLEHDLRTYGPQHNTGVVSIRPNPPVRGDAVLDL